MHNKKYALKLVQDKLDGVNNFSFSQIACLSGYSKLQIINFSKLLIKKDIDSLLVHGLSGKQSNNSSSPKEIEFIKNFKNQYPLISISQFMDVYHEDIIYNPDMIDIVLSNDLKPRSYSFFNSLYKRFNWVSPIKHKEFNKSYKSHPLREPMPRRGMLVMIDGTPHDWFENGDKWTLHLAIDDATGEILCGYFMPTECLYGYTMLLKLLVTLHGVPENIYSDRHTILVNHIKTEITHFGGMCEDLNINQIAALSPEAKGKVERMNFTIQNRLLNDIKRFTIKDYSELNSWFNSFYKDYLNKKYAYQPKEKKSSYKDIGNINLDYVFCKRYERIMLKGNVISYGDHYYQVITDDNNLKPIFRGSSLLVFESILSESKHIYVKYYNHFYNTKIVHERISRSEKIKITKIENQKILDQLLKERDVKQKARMNKISS